MGKTRVLGNLERKIAIFGLAGCLFLGESGCTTNPHRAYPGRDMELSMIDAGLLTKKGYTKEYYKSIEDADLDITKEDVSDYMEYYTAKERGSDFSPLDIQACKQYGFNYKDLTLQQFKWIAGSIEAYLKSKQGWEVVK